MALKLGKPSSKKKVPPGAAPTPNGVSSGAWWEEAVEVPRAGLPDATKMARRARRMRLYVKSMIVTVPLLVIAMFLTLANTLSSFSTGDTEVGDPAYVASRPTATLVVRQWLASDPQPIPGATFLGWERGNHSEYVAENGDTDIVDTHVFSVTSGNGALFEVAVPIADVNGVYTAMSTPSITPLLPQGRDANVDLWPELSREEASDAVKIAVEKWAQAYTKPDPTDLVFLIQDPDPEDRYQTLAGATLVGPVQINQAAGLEYNGDAATTLVVNATFSIRWAGQRIAEDTPLSQVTFDLRVDNAQEQTPFVTAWAGSGEGADLERYANAVVGVDIKPADPSAADTGGDGLAADPTATAPTGTSTGTSKGASR